MTIGHTTVTILVLVVGLEEEKECGVDNTINEDAALFRMEDNKCLSRPLSTNLHAKYSLCYELATWRSFEVYKQERGRNAK